MRSKKAKNTFLKPIYAPKGSKRAFANSNNPPRKDVAYSIKLILEGKRLEATQKAIHNAVRSSDW